MGTTISPAAGGLSPAELKALTDGNGNFSVTTIQWQDAATNAGCVAEPTTPTTPTTGGTIPGAPTSENAKLAKELLREARETKDPELKAELIKSAIDLLNTPATTAPTTPPTTGSTTEPKKFEGDALKSYLTAEGGNVEKGKDGGWAVGDGPGGGQKVEGEINRGQSLTFTAPVEQANNSGGTVELGKLYKNGPDGGYVEKARVTFYDENGKIVDEKVVQGTANGTATATTDKKFARVEVSPEDNGAGKKHNNSDFTLQSVTMNGAGATAPTSATTAPATVASMDDAKVAQVLDLLSKVAGLIPGLGAVAGPGLDLLAQLVDVIAGGKQNAN